MPTDGAGIREFVNPVLSEIQKARKSIRKDASAWMIMKGKLTRAEVTVRFQDRKGGHWRLTASGLLARALQHECDHLDGILFIDRALSLSPKRKAE